MLGLSCIYIISLIEFFLFWDWFLRGNFYVVYVEIEFKGNYWLLEGNLFCDIKVKSSSVFYIV